MLVSDLNSRRPRTWLISTGRQCGRQIFLQRSAGRLQNCCASGEASTTVTKPARPYCNYIPSIHDFCDSDFFFEKAKIITGKLDEESLFYFDIWEDKKLTVGLLTEAITSPRKQPACRWWDKVPDRFSRGAIFQIYPIERHAETVSKLP